MFFSLMTKNVFFNFYNAAIVKLVQELGEKRPVIFEVNNLF